VYTVTYIVIYSLLLLRWQKILTYLTTNWAIWALILLPIGSLLWSFDPDITIKNSFTLISSSLFGIYLTSRYNLRELLQILSWTFYISILFSFVFAIALPQYGMMSGELHQGRWRGVFLHKNGLGATMVVSCVVFLIRAFGDLRHTKHVWLALGLSVLLLILSGSSSALINGVALMAAFFVFHILRWSYLQLIPTVLAIVLIAVCANLWVADNSELLFGAVGRDASLTGRTELWQLAWDAVWQQPWLGYGYGGFWNGLEGESAAVWRASNFKAAHAHSGYLMLLLDFGWLGLTIFWFGFVRNVLRAINYMRSGTSSEYVWPLLLFTSLLISNQSESALLASNSPEWIFYIVMSFVINQQFQQQPSLVPAQLKA
jgi:exopolysaccharide production protein ExoQ